MTNSRQTSCQSEWIEKEKSLNFAFLLQLFSNDDSFLLILFESESLNRESIFLFCFFFALSARALTLEKLGREYIFPLRLHKENFLVLNFLKFLRGRGARSNEREESESNVSPSNAKFFGKILNMLMPRSLILPQPLSSHSNHFHPQLSLTQWRHSASPLWWLEFLSDKNW